MTPMEMCVRTGRLRPDPGPLPPPRLVGCSCVQGNRFAVVDYPTGTPAEFNKISDEQHAQACAALVRALAVIDGFDELTVYVALPRLLPDGRVAWCGHDDWTVSGLDRLFLWMADHCTA